MRPLFLLTLALIAGCSGPADDAHHGKAHGRPVEVNARHEGAYPIRVACTTGMVADLVRNVGGDRVAVTQLMGEGVDPHLYKASPGDVAKLNSADLILFSGLHLEGKMGDLFARLARRRPAFAVAEYLPPEAVLESDGAVDPHVWFDVSLWRRASETVQRVLEQYDPEGADGYRERAAAYHAKLDALHAWAKEQVATVPKERRVLVTAHDAFRYFGKAYDIEVRGIQGISTESEAGVREVNELVDFLAMRGIKAVFVESSVSERNVQALLEGAAARRHQVKVGGELFSDAMGPPGTPEGTYEGMVRHNVRTIVTALR